MRVYSICCAVLYTIGTVSLTLYKRPRALNTQDTRASSDGMQASLLADVAANGAEAVVDPEFRGLPVYGGPSVAAQNNGRSFSTGAQRNSSAASASGTRVLTDDSAMSVWVELQQRSETFCPLCRCGSYSVRWSTGVCLFVLSFS
jgi:hypothetical protein